MTVDTRFSVQHANGDGVRTWQRQCTQRDCLCDGGLLRTLGDPRGSVLICHHGRHSRSRFVRLRGWETWSWLVLDIITVAKAAVYGAYVYGRLEDRGEIEARVPTYWIVELGTCRLPVWEAPDLLHRPAQPTQIRLPIRIPGHSEFRREKGGVEPRCYHPA